LERGVRRAGPTSAAASPIATARHAQRRAYFSLLCICKKSSEFWTAHFDADQTQPRHLWRSFDELLGRRSVSSMVIDATDLHRHFDDKVAGICAATAGTEPPTFTSVPVGCVLRIFSPVTPADVEALVQSLPDKHCMSDPLPTWLLKKNADVLAHFLCQLFNWSLEHGVMPSGFKSAYITPLLKKPI